MGIFSWLSAGPGRSRMKRKRFADIGAFREHVMSVLRSKPDFRSVVPDAADPAIFQTTIGDGTWTMDVTNLYRRFIAYPDEDIDAEIERFLSLSGDDKARRLNTGNLVLVIRSADYVAHLAQQGVKVRFLPLTGDLVAVFMIDSAHSMSPLVEGELIDKTAEELREIASNNAAAWLPQVVADHSLEVGTLYYVEGNTFLSTSLMLLDDFWKAVSQEYPSDVLIALPRTDQLFVFDAANPRASEAARILIGATFRDGFNLLSEQVYQRRDGKLSIFETE